MNHSEFLDIACEEANRGATQGERAAGAVLEKSGQVVARSHDRCLALNDPIAGPEMNCIRRAGRRTDQKSLTLYSTGYPDMLCAGTIVQFSIGALVVGLPQKESAAISFLKQKNVPVSFIDHAGCVGLEQSS
jgi:cytosine deaminase